MKETVVEIVSVGTEILLGNIVNTNAQFLSEKLADLGLSVYYQQVVGDNKERLKEAASLALNRSDVVIFTGGLGPTDDDLTKETIAELTGKKLSLHEESKNRIIEFFKKRNADITENNYKQAMIPEDSVVLTNNNGTAPGVIISYGERKA